MQIASVKGTRDLYPELLAPIRHIFETWRRVSLRHGFVEYEGPTLELLDLYREKSGEELVGQLYRLTDSGGRELALRPEMTPTLARMVAARINALPKPIKWFSIPTLFRGENVQRGRLREFYQWNIDVIGSPDPIADAECILVGVDALRELGLSAADFCVHISSRELMAALLKCGNIAEPDHAKAFALLDKAAKLPREEMARRWGEAFGQSLPFDAVEVMLRSQDLKQIAAGWPGRTVSDAAANDALHQAASKLERLFTILQSFGITEYCKIDLHVVRGLAYYTGAVFEFFDRSEKERAICGGGRYDDLLGKLGKSREPAVGFGMGDVVLALILEEKGLLKVRAKQCEVFVIDESEDAREKLYAVVGALRRAGIAAEFQYHWQASHKQMKMADKLGASQVVIVGAAGEGSPTLRIKEMAGGREWDVPWDALLADPRRALSNAP